MNLGPFLWLCAFSITFSTAGLAQPRPQVLVLGTYHMANPGRDVHNISADDVLSPRRQSEIARLLDVLRQFRPTRIAVESSVTSRRVAIDYADYLKGNYSLSRNEIDQIGFRLARTLGHARVYPVDADGEFPYLRVRNYAEANALSERFSALESAAGEAVRRQAEILRNGTVLETLLYMNSDSVVAQSLASYDAFVPFGEPYEYAGPDLVAAWFQRNVRIYRNILALAASPEDRILVVFGAGHLGFLRQMVASDPAVELRTLADLIGRN
jgi:hypothetical protein